ncbi:iron ABC transporter permease [Hydrogenoanaerobacterium sp.]|uniref:FecCD family ABC transporter permease n=1 Tax=Hydrogenoanaerobacterium sp. TaxID=2953763 RepID=UPI0028A1ECF1|nr:iron ABC transporter permease [Hydrogenoanaerobacterium sp.]
MKNKREGFGVLHYIIMAAVSFAVFILCVCVGSVTIPAGDTLTAIINTIFGLPIPEGISGPIILFVRLPRVLNVALVGASLSLCGGAMQGLLRNPLADGSTLGVSSGASLGAVLAIALGLTIPGFTGGGIMLMAILFAFGSLMLMLSLAHKLDYSLSTNTIILIGTVFSMFAHSLISLIIAFSGEKVKTITFWTMGSLANTGYINVIVLLAALILFGALILRYCRELNAFAVGEDNARHVGVNVKKVKLVVLVAVSVLIGVCVSIGGTIGFVGLIVPHMTRMVAGPNHKRLLPACMFSGAVFLMLADLISRTILSPIELPIGVVTSFVGSVVFVYIFYKSKKVN